MKRTNLWLLHQRLPMQRCWYSQPHILYDHYSTWTGNDVPKKTIRFSFSKQRALLYNTTTTENLNPRHFSTNDPLSHFKSYRMVQRLVHQIQNKTATAWEKIEITSSGERAYHLDQLPLITLQEYHDNTKETSNWLYELLVRVRTSDDPRMNPTKGEEEEEDHYHVSSITASSNILIYVGFEAFYNLAFDELYTWLVEHQPNIPIVFSPLVQSTREFMQQQSKYHKSIPLSCSGTNTMVDSIATESSYIPLSHHDWKNRIILHLGASHAMDRVVFQEDSQGHLQEAWKDGRLILFSPELTVVDKFVYRSNLSCVLNSLTKALLSPSMKSPMDIGKEEMMDVSRFNLQPRFEIKRVAPCDYTMLDQDIQNTKEKVSQAENMDQVFAELYSLISSYTTQGRLDSVCYFDSGSESFRLYKSVSRLLDSRGFKIPWTRTGLIHARNAAIGDALHTFYATASEAFPIIVTGDTAALLAGGISMINLHSHNRFGVVVVLNNRGMAIEDVISKRSIEGHKYQYEYVKLNKKRDIFSLEQLKGVIEKDVLNALRDYLWGVSANRENAIVLNIDVQSIHNEHAKNHPDDKSTLINDGSFLDDHFGERYVQLSQPRKQLEDIIDVLYEELNEVASRNNHDRSTAIGNQPVKMVGCSAIEYMEVVSQLSMTSRQKLQFMPRPTDLLATRTLLPSLIESHRRTVSVANASSNFVNSNVSFSVFISNAVFGLDGLNNLISTHLEYGTGTLIHLAYDAAKTVTHYSLMGQVHRNFGTRPSEILPSLYRNHQMYEGQVILVDNLSTSPFSVAAKIRDGIRNPDVKVILVDMGAPNLTESLE